MRTKVFNLFTLIINSMLLVASVASISMMIVYEKLAAFGGFSMYVTLLVLVSSAIGMHYNIKSFRKNEQVESKWYLILRLCAATTAVINTIMAAVLIRGEISDGILDKSYLITRIIISFLMFVSILFIDIGKKTSFVGICFAPIYVTLFLSISMAIYGSGVLEPPYEYLNADENSWLVSLLLVLCIAASAVLLSAIFLGINYAMNYAVAGKYEKQEKHEQEELEKQAEEVKELEEEAEKKEALEEEVLLEEKDLENTANKDVETEVEPVVIMQEKPEENIKEQTDIKVEEKVEEITTKDPEEVVVLKEEAIKSSNEEKPEPVNENGFLEEPKGLVKSLDKSNKKVSKKPVNKPNPKPKKPAKKVEAKPDIDKAEKNSEKPDVKKGKIYHIAHHKPTGKWQVKAEGAQRALKVFKTQLEAINYAKSICNNSEGSSIRIHSVSGQIRKG